MSTDKYPTLPEGVFSQYGLGRRAPKRAPSLKFSQFWTGALPPHPTAVDYLAGLSNWAMLGNDQYGDCVAVMAANYRRLVTAALATEYYPSQQEVFALYQTQNPHFPNDDNGMDMQTMLEYWNRNTWGGCKVIAFAHVDATNVEQLKAAIAIFGAVLPGVNVTQANLNEFDAGRPWAYIPTSPVLGGHAIVAGGYLGKSSNDLRFITWGEETGFTDTFVAYQFEECWVAILPEHLGSKAFQQGVDLPALANAYQQITGKPLPVPTPTPTPAGQWVITKQTPTHVEMDLK